MQTLDSLINEYVSLRHHSERGLRRLRRRLRKRLRRRARAGNTRALGILWATRNGG